MVTQQLVDFIKGQISDGKKEEDIRQALLLHGWSETDIDAALNMARSGANIPSPPSTMPNYQMQNSNFARDNKPRLTGIGQLFSEAWNIYKKNFWRFWLIMIMFGLTLAAIVFIILFSSIYLGNLGAIPAGIIVTILFVLASFSGVLVQIGLLLVSGNNEYPKPFKEILKVSLKKLFPFWWLAILESLVVMGSTILAFPIIFLGMLGYINLFLAIGLAVLCLIPGIMIGIWISMANYVLLFEQEKGLNALSKSRYYVKGYWWAIFGRLLLIGLLTGIVSFVADIIEMRSVVFILQILTAMLIVPFTLCYQFSVYKSLGKTSRHVPFEPRLKERIIYSILAIIALVGICVSVFFGFKMFKTFLTEEFLGSNGALPGISNEQMIDVANMLAARNLAQLLYTKNGNFDNLCTNNQLNYTLPELINIQADINVDFCAASGTNFCLYSLSDNGIYLCTDSAGKAAEYQTLPNCSNDHISCD